MMDALHQEKPALHPSLFLVEAARLFDEGIVQAGDDGSFHILSCMHTAIETLPGM
jgi:hypothetical protein